MKAVVLSATFFVVSVLALGILLALRSSDLHKIDQLSRETHTALCAFKGDLRSRYRNGVEFLEEHPDGIPGISAAQIQRSLDQQKATLGSLVSLEC